MRKLKKLKIKNSNIKKYVFFLGLFFSMFSIGVILSILLLFKVKTIIVEGESRYVAEDIIKTSGIAIGSNLFIGCGKKNSEKIKTNLPYIGKVTFIKKIPSEIVIQIEETFPFCEIEYEDKYIVIDKKFKVLDIKEMGGEFCSINGLDVKYSQLGEKLQFKDLNVEKIFCQLLVEFDKYSLNVTNIDLSDQSLISFQYDKRIKVVLGLPEKIEYKMKTASKILEEKIKQNEKGELNLTLVVENGHSYFSPQE